jgi:MFS family permease
MRIYYGWFIVAITLLVFTLAVGASIQAYGLFVLPLSREFHLTRADANTGAIVLNIGMAMFAPIIGRLVDRHSTRLVMAGSAIAFAASYIVLGLSSNLWLSTVVLAVAVGAAVVGAGTVTSPVLVARWFTIHRGRAMGIATIGISAGPVIVIPVLSLLVEAMGWRQCLIVTGIAVGLALMLLAAVTRDRPGPNDIEPGSQGASMATPEAAEKPMGLGRILRLPQFWTIAIASSLTFGILTSNLVSLVPYAQGEGFSVTQAASVMSVYGLAALVGALLFAWVGDRFNRLAVFATLSSLLGLATGGLLLGHGFAIIVGCTALMGLAGGATSPAQLSLLADRFGSASFGVSSGASAFLSTFVSAIMLRFGGELFDRTGSYRLMFLSFLFIGVLSGGLMLVTGALGPGRAAREA